MPNKAPKILETVVSADSSVLELVEPKPVAIAVIRAPSLPGILGILSNRRGDDFKISLISIFFCKAVLKELAKSAPIFLHLSKKLPSSLTVSPENSFIAASQPNKKAPNATRASFPIGSILFCNSSNSSEEYPSFSLNSFHAIACASKSCCKSSSILFIIYCPFYVHNLEFSFCSLVQLIQLLWMHSSVLE